MSDEKPPESSGGIKMGDLKKLIQDVVAEAVKPGDKPTDKSDDAPATVGGIADKVRQEIEAIRAREKEETEKVTMASELAELKEKAKEKAPVERRRIHKFMGWGENAD